MPKVTAPLFSLDASGSVANLLTYRDGPRGPVVVQKSRPTGPASVSQLAIRATTKALMQRWPTLDANAQASWSALATTKNVSNVNAYLIENYARIRAGQSTLDYYPTVNGFRLYRDGTVPISLNNLFPTFSQGGHLTLIDGEVFATPDLTQLSFCLNFNLNGHLCFQGLDKITFLGLDALKLPACPDFSVLPRLTHINFYNSTLITPPDFRSNLELTTFNLSSCHIHAPPLIAGATALLSINLTNTQIATLPDRTGCTALAAMTLDATPLHTPPTPSTFGPLYYLSMLDCPITNPDAFFIAAAAALNHATAGYIDLSGQLAASVTDASAGARAALTPPNGNWELYYNE